MSVSITVPGASFSKYVSKVLMPYFDVASSYMLFGTDAASSLVNRAYGATIHPTAIATPTYSTGYATVSGINGINTGFVLDTPYTQLIVAQHAVAGQALAMLGRGAGNPDNFNDMLVLQDGGTNQLQCWPNGAADAGLQGLTSVNFRMMGARYGGTGTKPGVFTHNGTSLVTGISSVNVVRSATPTNTLKIGASYNPGTAQVRVAAVMLFPTQLTDAQLVEIYAYLKPFLLTRGVTVV